MPQFHAPAPRVAPGKRSERGSAIPWALVFVVLISGLIVSHTIYLAANRREMDVRFRQTALATSLARSGASDALAWFQRQSTQPVLAFTPTFDAATVPVTFDTIDPVLGLVREFEIRGGLWGRYEVRRGEVSDVSAQRGLAANAGSVWELRSRGIVYERRDGGVRFDQAPNHVVAMTCVESELRSLCLEVPAPAAVCITDPASLVLGPQARIDGTTSAGLAYRESLAGLAPSSALVRGTPAVLPVADYDPRPERFFRTSFEQLTAMADVLVRQDGSSDAMVVDVSTGVARLERTLWDSKVVFVDRDLVVDADHPLLGKLALVVRGNLTFLAGNGSDASGLIVTTGDARLEGAMTFRGTLVVGGRLEAGVASSGPVNVVYDPGLLDLVRAEIGRYRFSKSFSLGAIGGAADLAPKPAGVAAVASNGVRVLADLPIDVPAASPAAALAASPSAAASTPSASPSASASAAAAPTSTASSAAGSFSIVGSVSTSLGLTATLTRTAANGTQTSIQISIPPLLTGGSTIPTSSGSSTLLSFAFGGSTAAK